MQAGFNPRPSSLTGDAGGSTDAELAYQFQSTPVITDGRRIDGKVTEKQQVGFNPRPSSLTGDARMSKWSHLVAVVSIHARHH